MNTKCNILSWVCIALLCLPVSAQKTSPEIQWKTAAEAYISNQTPPTKKIFVDVYTDWCGWCKRMDNSTFSDSLVAVVMNHYFIPVKFDAESKAELTIGDTTYRNPFPDIKRSTHDWAKTILKGKLSYPSFAFLDSKFTPMSAPIQGYQTAENLVAMLAYIGRDEYTTYEFEEYQKIFRTEILPKIREDIELKQHWKKNNIHPKPIAWDDIESAAKKTQSEKTNRLIFTDIYTDWCGWCKHMDATTFSDPLICAIMEVYFYPVKFDAEQNKQISLNGNTYSLQNMGQRGIHQWAALVLDNKLGFPSYVVLDKRLNVVNTVAGYQTSEQLEMYLSYYGRRDNEKYTWEEYQKIYSQQIRPLLHKEILEYYQKKK